MGLEARDAQTGAVLGKIADIMDLPAGNVYVIRGGEREIMVPAVPQFIAETNVEGGYIKVRLIEGMLFIWPSTTGHPSAVWRSWGFRRRPPCCWGR